jgi:hypothetical protein
MAAAAGGGFSLPRRGIACGFRRGNGRGRYGRAGKRGKQLRDTHFFDSPLIRVAKMDEA